MPEPKLPADIQAEAAKAMHIELNRGMSVGVTAWNGVGTRDSYLAAVTAVADVVKPWHQDTLQARVAELEEHERERIANAQTQYSQAWNAWVTLLKRIGTAAGVELPDDLRYHKYEKQILAKITDLRAGQPNT